MTYLNLWNNSSSSWVIVTFLICDAFALVLGLNIPVNPWLLLPDMTVLVALGPVLVIEPLSYSKF